MGSKPGPSKQGAASGSKTRVEVVVPPAHAGANADHRLANTVGQLDTRMRQLEAKMDSMALGFAHSSFVLSNSQQSVAELCRRLDIACAAGERRFTAMKEARENLVVAVEELRKGKESVANNAPVMHLIERHIDSCEQMAGVVNTLSKHVITTVTELGASTEALATALGTTVEESSLQS
ncbi:hypothetical protein H1R20_g15811, partial [Candolleomyces eurysporus]